MGELQVLPRIRLPLGCLRHSDHCRRYDIDHCRLLLPQRRKLPLAMDSLRIWRFHRGLRLSLRRLLLHFQDSHAWPLANDLLLWIHVTDRTEFGTLVWYPWSLGRQQVREGHLPEREG